MKKVLKSVWFLSYQKEHDQVYQIEEKARERYRIWENDRKERVREAYNAFERGWGVRKIKAMYFS